MLHPELSVVSITITLFNPLTAVKQQKEMAAIVPPQHDYVFGPADYNRNTAIRGDAVLSDTRLQPAWKNMKRNKQTAQCRAPRF